MKKSTFSEYVVHDLLGHMDGMMARAMFGGYGIYKDGVMFALISDDQLYFKVSEENQKDFESYGSAPFVYSKGGSKPIAMSYYLLPEEIADDQELLTQWVIQSHKIAVKSKKKK